jgi:uncharacterized repeat protein (TIGR01451 family)
VPADDRLGRGRRSFTATLTTSKPDRNPSNNATTLTSVVLPSSDLAVASSSDIRKFRSGAIVTYTFAVTNHGPQDAHDVSFNDLMSKYVEFVSFEPTGGPAAILDTIPHEAPHDCFEPPCGIYIEARFPIVPSGTTATFRLVVRAKPSVEAADIVNRLRVRSTSVDPTERNNEAFVVTFAGPEADLALSATRLPSRSEVQIPIAIEIANDGPDTVNHVTVNQALTSEDDRYEWIEQVKFMSATPSQGTCSAPEVIYPIGSPNPLPYWTLDCTLGTLPPGAKATLAIVLERAAGAGRSHISRRLRRRRTTRGRRTI